MSGEGEPGRVGPSLGSAGPSPDPSGDPDEDPIRAPIPQRQVKSISLP